MENKNAPKKFKRDPRDEYKVVHIYNNDSDKTLNDILTRQEFVEYMYKTVIKYS